MDFFFDELICACIYRTQFIWLIARLNSALIFLWTYGIQILWLGDFAWLDLVSKTWVYPVIFFKLIVDLLAGVLVGLLDQRVIIH